MILGNVLVVVAIALIPLVGVLWRPRIFGVGLLGGLLIMLVGQVASAILLGSETVPLSSLGLTAAQASQAQIHARYVLNGWFSAEVEGVFAILILWVARVLVTDRPLRPARPDPVAPRPEAAPAAGWTPTSPEWTQRSGEWSSGWAQPSGEWSQASGWAQPVPAPPERPGSPVGWAEPVEPVGWAPSVEAAPTDPSTEPSPDPSSSAATYRDGRGS